MSRSPWLRLGTHVLGVGSLTILLWPLAYAVWVSFTPGELLTPPVGEWSLRWYWLFLESPQWTNGLWNSLEVALLSVLGAGVAGLGLGVAITRHHFRGRHLLASAVLLPLFLPTVVLAMGLLPWMRLLGLWGTQCALASAHSLWCLPVVFLVVRSALEQVDPDLESAARGLGASAWLTFRRVTLPLIAPALLMAMLMAFILSLNEFTLALFLTTAETETLPKVIWPNLRYTLTPLVAAASCITMLVTLVALVFMALLLRMERVVGHLLARH